MRGIIQQLLATTGHPVIQGSALDEQPGFPFIIHKFAIGTRTPSGRGRPGLEVWVYDSPGSYLQIDRILMEIREIFRGYPFTSINGTEHIAVIDWVNDSADLPAEEFGGITRMSAYNLVGRSA
jgi:hypothetical protein